MRVLEGDAELYDQIFWLSERQLKRYRNGIERNSTRTQTVVIMVDELDRCLPSYAIKVLERIHHVFNEIGKCGGYSRNGEKTDRVIHYIKFMGRRWMPIDI